MLSISTMMAVLTGSIVALYVSSVPRLPAFFWGIGLPSKFDNNPDNNAGGKLWTMVDTDQRVSVPFQRESGQFGHRWTVLAGLKVRSSTAELRAPPSGSYQIPATSP